MVRLFLCSMFICLSALAATAQSSAMQGRVSDENTGEPLPFTNIYIKSGETFIDATESDLEGNYNFSNVPAGTYDVFFSFVGFQTVHLSKVIFYVGQIVRQDVTMKTAIDLDVVEVIEVVYDEPIICVCPSPPALIIDSKFIEQNAGRNISDLTNAAANVNQKDAGEQQHFMSDRGNGTNTYVDGALVNGVVGLSETEIGQIQVLTSGIPAEFGDATGGVVNIITKEPSYKFSGSVQLETSQFLDAFGYNRADITAAGPLIKRPAIDPEDGDTIRNRDGKVMHETVLGYRLSGSFFTSLDERPSALPSYKVKEETLQALEASPLVRNESGELVLATNYLTESDLEFTRVRPNARESTGYVNGKLELRPNKELFFVVGGQLQYDFGKNTSVLNRLLNYNHNNQYNSSMWRINGRMRHAIAATTFSGEETSDELRTGIQPFFQNLSYELQLDYTRNDYREYDPRYEDRFFEYGYVGKINRHLAPVAGIIDSNYVLNSTGDTLSMEPVYGHAAYQIMFDGFEANTAINPTLAAYNNLLDMSEITSMEELEIINGRFTGNRLSAYSLFNSPGQTGTATREGSRSAKTNSTQLRANVRANFDLVMNRQKSDPIRHSIQLGGVYEQRIARSYTINPFSLWTLADQSANSHLSFATDQEHPLDETFFDPATQRNYQMYDPLIRQDEQGNLVEMTQFGEKVRESLGQNARDWVNVHALTPDQLSLEMFDATTLVQGRQRVLDYYGYDYLGNPLGAGVQFNDFFTATDPQTGRKTRPVAPIKPIYVAGYIQDQFTFKDMIFKVGVRFDSYDANTKVLKDPYSLAGYYNAGEFFGGQSNYILPADAQKPANIGDDFAVYVNDNNPDASVVGYRDGDQWYDKNGLPVNTPNELGSTIIPALRGFGTTYNDLQGEDYDPNLAFRDYKPTLIVMPRIAFAFPISQTANFYANYDVLAQRPPDGNVATALTYYNFRELVAGGEFIGNPNLKSQRSINYEVGFQQRITAFSKFKISMVYREERDLIQLQQYVLAYPVTYTTFGNSDFATFKSFGLEYEMRKHGRFNKNLSILANYTLQFAEGTGSSPTSSSNTAVQELKYVFALDYDQRHTFYLNMDYRYSNGAAYNGPKIKNKKTNRTILLLQDMGLNLTFNLNSGTPYTHKAIPGGIGTNFSDRITEGSINGARMPWNFRVDLRLDRDITIGKYSKYPLRMNIYIRVQNLFDTRNVLNVYAATGSPTDDGFLTMQGSPGQSLLNSYSDSYSMLYNLRMNDPFNISRPRRIFLGVKFVI